MTPSAFVNLLADVKMDSVFNPWRDQCPVHDRRDAPTRRRQNLQRFLDGALAAGADTIWIARDLGYRGGRRTGVPMTDEVHLSAASALLGGTRFERATEGQLVAERTAAVIWKMLARIGRPVVLWNVFAFHPHEADNPFSNRCHTRAEREATWPILNALIEMVHPQHIVAIGRDSQAALGEVGVPVSCVRHPSYGGQSDFINGVSTIYEISDGEKPNLAQLPFAAF